MEAALGTVAVADPIPITISQVGFFPNPQRPHSLFADVEAGPALAELAAAIDMALAPLGCDPETRPYRPHIHRSRALNRAMTFAGSANMSAAMTDFEFGSFDARDFHLYVSTPAARRLGLHETRHV